jgi:hypothetical protein
VIDLAAFLEKRRALAALPEGYHRADTILKEIVDPLLEALRLSGRWVSLQEAMEHTGLSEAFFRAKLDSFGGKSRLEFWAEKGMAVQVGRPWLISPAVIPEPKRCAFRGSREEMSAEEILQQLEGEEE